MNSPSAAEARRKTITTGVISGHATPPRDTPFRPGAGACSLPPKRVKHGQIGEYTEIGATATNGSATATIRPPGSGRSRWSAPAGVREAPDPGRAAERQVYYYEAGATRPQAKRETVAGALVLPNGEPERRLAANFQRVRELPSSPLHLRCDQSQGSLFAALHRIRPIKGSPFKCDGPHQDKILDHPVMNWIASPLASDKIRYV